MATWQGVAWWFHQINWLAFPKAALQVEMGDRPQEVGNVLDEYQILLQVARQSFS